jgi:hypothetical protein
MKVILTVIGILLVIMGGIWFFQGINVLPGSFMTGQVRWAIYGGIAVVLGIALIVLANRKKRSPPIT